MTEKRANEILRTKYPEAEIVKNMGGVATGRISVIFTPGGKVYSYLANSYQQVLEKLGFEVLYKHNVVSYKNEIARLQKEIEAGGYEDVFGFSGEDFYEYTAEEIKDMQNEIHRLNALINSAIIC